MQTQLPSFSCFSLHKAETNLWLRVSSLMPVPLVRLTEEITLLFLQNSVRGNIHPSAPKHKPYHHTVLMVFQTPNSLWHRLLFLFCPTMWRPMSVLNSNEWHSFLFSLPDRTAASESSWHQKVTRYDILFGDQKGEWNTTECCVWNMYFCRGVAQHRLRCHLSSAWSDGQDFRKPRCSQLLRVHLQEGNSWKPFLQATQFTSFLSRQLHKTQVLLVAANDLLKSQLSFIV